MATLNNNELLDLVVSSIAEGGWNCLVVDDKKPFRLRVYNNENKGIEVAIYIWNCTHGGGARRAKDEYRIQLTSRVPQKIPNAITIILGWHAGYGVFAGFDIDWHTNQDSQSPSIQVKEDTLKGAHQKAFSISRRQNGELAVAFQPQLIVDYILNSRVLHEQGITTADLSLLNDLDAVQPENIESASSTERKLVISKITKKYRAADFRLRVLGAYRNQCAVCGVQLKLIDAAHIVPVASEFSTDETMNGVAMCKLHHFAYDRNLISFDVDYLIQVSSTEESKLKAENFSSGIDTFKDGLRTALILPTDKRDYPPAEYIEKSREVRRWQP